MTKIIEKETGKEVIIFFVEIALTISFAFALFLSDVPILVSLLSLLLFFYFLIFEEKNNCLGSLYFKNIIHIGIIFSIMMFLNYGFISYFFSFVLFFSACFCFLYKKYFK